MPISDDQAPPNCTTHQTVARASPPGGLVCMPTDNMSGIAATSPEEAFLFEAYVQAFCAMDVP